MPRSLLHMWRYPRMVAWFFTTVMLIMLVRLPFWFFNADIIPYYLDFNPGAVLMPLIGVFWGPAGAWGCAAGTLLGDYAYDLWGPLSGYRAAGSFLFALSAKRLWEAFPYRAGSFTGHAPAWSPALRFVFLSLPGCLVCASWSAFGAEVQRIYPFSYYMTLQLAEFLILVPLLGLALYRIMAREMVPTFGTWKDILPPDAHPNPLTVTGILCILIGGLGACLAGVLVDGWGYGLWPFRTAHVLGSTGGPAVSWSVGPFLLLQVVGFFLRKRAPLPFSGSRGVQMSMPISGSPSS